MAKLLLLQLLLTFVVAAFTVPPTTSFNHPKGCVSTNCVYTASWTMVKEGISVTVSTKKTKTSEWAAMGFINEKNPSLVDIVSGGYIKNKQFIIHGLLQDGKLLEFKEPKLKTSVTRSGGNLLLNFTHPIKPSNPKDFTFADNDCYTFVFFVNNKDFTETKGYILPKMSSSAVKSSKICMKDLKKPGITLTTLVTGTTEHVMETPAPIGGDVIFKPKGEEGFPRGCTWEACIYRVQWEFYKDRFSENARFTVMARQENDTYIAFGFSSEKNTNKILAVYGYKQKSGKSVIVKGQILHGNTKPQLSDGTGIGYEALQYGDGNITLSFDLYPYTETRGEDNDFLAYPYYYVLMVGGGPVLNDIELGPLGENALQFTDKKISLVGDGEDVIFKQQGEEGIPLGCTGEACLYRVEWHYDKDRRGEYLEFTVKARQKKDSYIGFGFSSEKNANKILAVYGYMKKSGENVVVQGKILNGNTKPQLSDNDDLGFTDLTYENGVFKLEFAIFMETTGEDNVKPFPYYYVLMVGGGPVLNDTELGPLEKKELQFTDKKINVMMKANPSQSPIENIMPPSTTPLSPHHMETLPPPPSDVIYKPKGEEGIPRGCEGKMCLYTVKWDLAESHYVAMFTVMAKQKKESYIGFGFSTEKNANKIFAVYGYMQKSGDKVTVTGKIVNGSRKPELSDRKGVWYSYVTYEDGVFTLMFEMNLKTTDKDNVNLLNPYYYVLMVGGGPVLNDTELGPLGKNALQFTDKKISLVDEVRCMDEKTGTKLVVPGPENCRKYIECHRDSSYMGICDDKFYFNPKTDSCTNEGDLTPERKKECGL